MVDVVCTNYNIASIPLPCTHIEGEEEGSTTTLVVLAIEQDSGINWGFVGKIKDGTQVGHGFGLL